MSQSICVKASHRFTCLGENCTCRTDTNY